ncbi:uncharacterized protein LOC120710462 [Panicum virgatum]|nr:uncharacterized protein LOC120710462 [Panicum virgatum]
MDAEAPRGAPGAGCSRHGGQHQGGAAAAALTCTLMDDLSIGPPARTVLALATGAAGAAGKRRVVVDPAAVQEATVRLGHEEGLEILRASLQSSTVFTDVFLRGGMAPTLEFEPVSHSLLGLGNVHKCMRMH